MVGNVSDIFWGGFERPDPTPPKAESRQCGTTEQDLDFSLKWLTMVPHDKILTRGRNTNLCTSFIPKNNNKRVNFPTLWKKT